MAKDRTPRPIRFSSAFKVGAIALVFMVIGFQTALFVRQAAVDAVVAHRDAPDTVYVVSPPGAGKAASGPGASVMRFADAESGVRGALVGGAGPGRSSGGRGLGVAGSRKSQDDTHGDRSGERWGQDDGSRADTIRRDAEHSRRAREMAGWGDRLPVGNDSRNGGRRAAESFRFDPNTVSVEDLQRLGFSPRQAQAIDNYRSKGGRFARKSDFARSFVVADSVYARLEPYIDIPLVDINAADSAEFDSLPGIGPYFAAKMVEYRGRLRGYSYAEQLTDIWNFGEERYEGIKDLIMVGECEAYPLWELPEDSLALHPYIGRRAARGVILYIRNTPPSERSVADLADVLPAGTAAKLSRCRIAP